MKTLPAPLVTKKNLLATTSAWIYLYEVHVDDATVLYLAANPVAVTFNNQSYTPFPISPPEIEQDGKGNLATVRLSVSAVDRSIVAYLEQTDAGLLGRRVYVRLVNSDHLGDPAYKVEDWFEIIDVSVDNQAATFTLGHYNLLNIKFPRRRYIRSKCGWAYRSPECGYNASDEFGHRTRQDWKAGGDAAKLYGWTAVNTANASAADVDVTTAGKATVTHTATNTAWNGAVRTGPQLYGVLRNGPAFDVECLTAGNPDAATEGEGLLVQSASDPADWLGWWVEHTGAALRLLMRSTVDGVSADTAVAVATDRYLRVARVDNTYTCYSKAASTSAWTQRATVTRADIPAGARLGLVGFTGNVAGNLVSRFDYFRFASGGIATCAKTAADCATHANKVRFGGFPGIPYGRLVS